MKVSHPRRWAGLCVAALALALPVGALAKPRRRSGLCGAAVALALPVGACAKPRPNQASPVDPQSPLRSLEVSPAKSEIHVDGVLDEAAWQSAAVVDLPYEWFPGVNVT